MHLRGAKIMHPITIEEGTNILAGTTGKGILDAYTCFKNGQSKKGKIPELWDGKTAQRIVGILMADGAPRASPWY